MLKLNASSEMKYLANMQFGPAGNRKYQNKSPSAFAGLLENQQLFFKTFSLHLCWSKFNLILSPSYPWNTFKSFIQRLLDRFLFEIMVEKCKQISSDSGGNKRCEEHIKAIHSIKITSKEHLPAPFTSLMFLNCSSRLQKQLQARGNVV